MVKHLLKLTCCLFLVIIKIYLTQFLGKMAWRSWEKSHLVYHFFPSQGHAGPGWVPSLLSPAQPEQKGCAELSQLIACTGCVLSSDGAAQSTGGFCAFPAAFPAVSVGLRSCCGSGWRARLQVGGIPHEWRHGRESFGSTVGGWITGRGQHISSPGGFPCVFPSSSSWSRPLG